MRAASQGVERLHQRLDDLLHFAEDEAQELLILAAALQRLALGDIRPVLVILLELLRLIVGERGLGLLRAGRLAGRGLSRLGVSN
jgi:hypothetical protein